MVDKGKGESAIPPKREGQEVGVTAKRLIEAQDLNPFQRVKIRVQQPPSGQSVC